MPLLTRWFIRTGFLYLVATLLLGILLALGPVASLPFSVARLDPVYLHLFMLGWVSQLIFGVANWMFPVYTREQPRHSERLGWTSYLLLNGGLLLRAVSQPLADRGAGTLWSWLFVASTLVLLLAAVAFVVNSWGRIKGH